MLWPILDELALDNEWKNVKIVKINVENPENGPLAQSQSICFYSKKEKSQ